MKKIFYGRAIYNQKEIKAANKVLKKQNLTLIDGVNVKKLEAKIAKLFGKKYGLMVNSGSSANLLALSSFNFKKNSEIITPTLTFSTTVAPIYQLGLIPYFIGTIDRMFIADSNQIEKCINEKTVAIMIPNLLGNIPNWRKINLIARKYDLKIIEDSADTIGYTINKKNTGKITDVVTNSFYASHIINGAGTGGIVCFNDRQLYEKAKLLRGWGRSSATFNESENIKKRFNIKISGIDYDAKYVFSDLGYNFLPSEISAAFALEQLKKLPGNISSRIKNFKKIYNFFKNYPKYFKMPITFYGVKTAWLAYPLLIIKNKKFSRRDLQIFFEKNNIQTRTIFTGNILKQPVMKNKIYKASKNSQSVSNDVMRNGILIGCHQGLSESDISYIFKVFNKFSKIKKL